MYYGCCMTGAGGFATGGGGIDGATYGVGFTEACEA